VPFSEGAQYGIELFYPYENELHVTTRDGHNFALSARRLHHEEGRAARRRLPTVHRNQGGNLPERFGFGARAWISLAPLALEDVPRCCACR